MGGGGVFVERSSMATDLNFSGCHNRRRITIILLFG